MLVCRGRGKKRQSETSREAEMCDMCEIINLCLAEDTWKHMLMSLFYLRKILS